MQSNFHKIFNLGYLTIYQHAKADRLDRTDGVVNGLWCLSVICPPPNPKIYTHNEQCCEEYGACNMHANLQYSHPDSRRLSRTYMYRPALRLCSDIFLLCLLMLLPCHAQIYHQRHLLTPSSESIGDCVHGIDKISP